MDPLAAEHVIGEGLPADVRAEVEAEVEVFRSGRRGGKALRDRELLETIYRPFRRALVTLRPLPAPAPSIQLPEGAIEKVIGKSVPCAPEHQDLFAGKAIPTEWLYEGTCRPKGAVK